MPLVSINGLHQLHIFIFFLAIFHVAYSALTMALGRAKASINSILVDALSISISTFAHVTFILLLPFMFVKKAISCRFADGRSGKRRLYLMIMNFLMVWSWTFHFFCNHLIFHNRKHKLLRSLPSYATSSTFLPHWVALSDNNIYCTKAVIVSVLKKNYIRLTHFLEYACRKISNREDRNWMSEMVHKDMRILPRVYVWFKIGFFFRLEWSCQGKCCDVTKA